MDPESGSRPRGSRFRARGARLRTGLRSWLRASDVALAVVVFGLALQLRAWLTWRPLWLDEQMVARNIRDRDFAGLATVLDHNQAAPIGWLWAQRLAVELAGTGERALRMVPFLLAAGALVLAWLAVRRWLGPVGTCATVALFAVNDYLLRYATETKQYSGDVFWVLLLIVLGWWALTAPARPRRYVVWWAAAAVASLFSMGAILTMPALALVMVGTAWWRGRWRLALRATLPGLLWLAAFGLHYWLILRQLLANETMEQFWARRGYPPPEAGRRATLEWSLHRLEVLAADPLSLNMYEWGRPWLLFAATVFWALVLVGALAAMRGVTRGAAPIGLLLVAPLVTGFLLAVLRISPLYMRLAMWIMPGLFLAVGFALDAATRAATRAVAPSATLRAVAPSTTLRAAGVAGAAVLFSAAVAFAPLPVAAVRPVPLATFDDREAIRWLAARHRPGDLTVGVHGSEHAIAWYDPDGRLAPLVWVQHSTEPTCEPAVLRQRLAGHRRVLFYGDRRNPPAIRTAEALSALLDHVGRVAQTGDFGTRGFVGVVELRPEPNPTAPDPSVSEPTAPDPSVSDPDLPGAGCLAVLG